MSWISSTHSSMMDVTFSISGKCREHHACGLCGGPGSGSASASPLAPSLSHPAPSPRTSRASTWTAAHLTIPAIRTARRSTASCSSNHNFRDVRFVRECLFSCDCFGWLTDALNTKRRALALVHGYLAEGEPHRLHTHVLLRASSLVCRLGASLMIRSLSVRPPPFFNRIVHQVFYLCRYVVVWAITISILYALRYHREARRGLSTARAR